jgi:hypothetical protein
MPQNPRTQALMAELRQAKNKDEIRVIIANLRRLAFRHNDRWAKWALGVWYRLHGPQWLEDSK